MRDLLGLSIIVLTAAVMSVYLLTQSTGVHFETANELRDFLASQGFSLHEDGKQNISRNTFFVADHPLGEDEVAQLACRQECGLSPRWEGIVWVSQICVSGHELVPSSIGGNTRVWGNVLVAGDSRLMDQLEQFIRGEAIGEITDVK